MGIEIRKGRKYYYHCHRENGRVRKIYYGSGLEAELAAQRFADLKRERQEQRDRLKAEKSQLEAADRGFAQIHDGSLTNDQPTSEVPAPPMASSASRPPETPEQVSARMQELLAARQAGDPSADAELAELVDRFPAIGFNIGDLGKQVQEAWLNLITGTDQVFRAAVRNKLDLLRSQFTVRPNDPVDNLLIERILISWLQISYADARIAQAGNVDRGTLEYLSHRQQQSQRQHLAAIKSWMQLKQLAAGAPDRTPSTTSTSNDSSFDCDLSKRDVFPYEPIAKSA